MTHTHDTLKKEIWSIVHGNERYLVVDKIMQLLVKHEEESEDDDSRKQLQKERLDDMHKGIKEIVGIYNKPMYPGQTKDILEEVKKMSDLTKNSKGEEK